MSFVKTLILTWDKNSILSHKEQGHLCTRAPLCALAPYLLSHREGNAHFLIGLDPDTFPKHMFSHNREETVFSESTIWWIFLVTEWSWRLNEMNINETLFFFLCYWVSLQQKRKQSACIWGAFDLSKGEEKYVQSDKDEVFLSVLLLLLFISLFLDAFWLEALWELP